MSVDRLLASLTSRQLTEWIAYAELEPFGPLREDYRFGELVAAVLNTAPGRKKDSKVFKPSDIFESLKGPAKPQSVDAMKAVAQAITRQMGGVVRKAGDPVPAPAKQVKANPPLPSKGGGRPKEAGGSQQAGTGKANKSFGGRGGSRKR